MRMGASLSVFREKQLKYFVTLKLICIFVGKKSVDAI